MDKEKQKQAITEIMNEDAKDGLYQIGESNKMVKQQTAVEWLEQRFEKFLAYYEGHHKAEPYSIHQLSNDFEQAKQMEREQIIYAFVAGDERGTNGIPFNAEQYYTQTYVE